jgi:hypothetical protein
MKKRQSKRSNTKHPDLTPELNLKTRSDLLDQDYIHKLSPDEKDWLNKFNSEYIGDNLDREKPKKNFHNTKKLIKDCGDRNNARNRDILTRAKASNQLTDYEELYEEPDSNDYENDIIEELDKKQIRESLDWLAEGLERDEVKLEKSLINESSKASELEHKTQDKPLKRKPS